MTKRTKPPFRADHVGSLLRPQYLLDAREKFKRKEILPGQLKQVEDKAIAEAVRLQEELGLQSVTDGEFRRTWWHIDFLQQFKNVAMVPSKVKVQFHTHEGDIERMPPGIQVSGPL